MFGYISINKAEMKFKDYDVYHSYYCGLCKVLKECYGRRGQVTLSFDMTFLVILLTGLYEPDTKTAMVRCIAHPMQKHAAKTNEFTEYAAAINMLLSYYKCEDDWADEHRKKAFVAAKLLHSKIKKIEKLYPVKCKVISENLAQISKYEAENEQNLDLMSGLFGNIMAEIFAYRHDEWESSLRKIGFFLGKFIYLMDAYEDLEKDLRKFYPNMLPMGAGCCTKCKTCTCPEAPCRFPDQAFSSMEAYGMLVMQVCQANHLDYYYGPGKIAYTSCYLLK